MEKICPKCGASSNDVTFNGSFCFNCYKDSNKPVELPPKITIYTCRECGAQRFRSWEEESLEGSILSALKDKKLGYPEIEILEHEVKVKYENYAEEISINLIRKNSICDTCMRRNSNYYEAIIQIRGDEYTQNDEFINGLVNALEKASFISNIVHLKEGIDLYVGDKMVARSVISSMRLKAKVTYTLYSEKDSKRIYRTTFLIRKDKKKEVDEEEE
jgi:NMD protein affecting ribosome stability and mRNA decay